MIKHLFQDSCFQKPAMRRALGELTNSPTPRRALGELTNSPRLLDQQRSPRFLSPIHAGHHATPTKEQVRPFNLLMRLLLSGRRRVFWSPVITLNG